MLSVSHLRTGECKRVSISWGNLTAEGWELVEKCFSLVAAGKMILIGGPTCPSFPRTFLVFALHVPHCRNPLILKGILQDSSWGPSGVSPSCPEFDTHLYCLSLFP